MGEKGNSLPTRKLFFKSLVALLLLALVPVTQVWADEYLDTLKAEANSGNPSIGPAEETDDGRPQPRTDDQPQMEEWLKNNYVGSYMFYQRLSEGKREAVYRLYRSGAEITRIRKKINDLLKQ